MPKTLQNKIDAAIKRSLKWILANQMTDGGFVQNESGLTFGSKKMHSKRTKALCLLLGLDC